MDLAYEDVRRILMENDPEGFIRIGAPNDEYDGEAKRIHRSLSALHRKPDFKYILELVEYVFYTSFDTIDGSDVCWRKPQYSWLKDDDLTAHFIAFEIHSLMK